jgi:hypothetical protein
MKTFKRFIVENKDDGPKFKRDNPGGDWLKHKQEDADADTRRHGLRGATTGWFDKNLHLPVSSLKDLPGAMGEHKFRNDATSSKSEQLTKDVGHPKNFQKNGDHPIMIGVNHRGEAHVMEGNHRLAYAKRHKISHIHTELKYYNGGEDVKDGTLPPHDALKLHHSNVFDDDDG